MESLDIIKKLRESSGAGMVDCKKALEEAGGDIDKAVEILRKKGIAKAAKRGGRDTSEGVIKLAVNEDKTEGYIVEISAETDFVARNDKFQNFVDKVLELIKENKPKDMDGLMAIKMENDTVKESLANLSGTIGEKMEIKRFDILSTAGTIAAYSHMGGRIGVLASLSEKDKDDLTYDIAMQVAAASPKYIYPEDVPTEEVNKEKEIYREQLLGEGKPENIIEKIIDGKINKYFAEVCLVKQDFIKDDKKKVEEILAGVKVENFIRYSL